MPDKRLLWLGSGLVAATALYLLWGLGGRVWFILELRGIKLAGLVLVGIAVAFATVLFQTLSGNRILTPAIMGFDALFLLVQASLVLSLGGFGYAQLPSVLLFGVNSGAMMWASVLLFAAVLHRARHDIQLMILVGVVFGLMFRSLTSFIQRLIAPSEFAMIQGAMFAQFSGINRVELRAASLLLLMVLIWLWPRMAVLDVVALGRAPARSLGLDYDRVQMQMLCVIAALVSVSTALVGPITFLGLLVASLTHTLMRTHRHALLLPASALIAAIILVSGQAVFERVLRMQSTLTVVIEFVGGLLFLYLLARGKLR
ncbi:MAG: iron chelate uptake ABC transporter family permease subunit [Dinoroseobacter sp.]|nr:iron chelate uptake ABC transporter family permease subunit [Dinoroseobacter sp.]